MERTYNLTRPAPLARSGHFPPTREEPGPLADDITAFLRDLRSPA
ncbi:MAG TPA: hypothetical protein VH478_02595 [Trebonia sp.]|jgi:hypothetical protein|nr:hypothetical protein [Trebonia sp.]